MVYLPAIEGELNINGGDRLLMEVAHFSFVFKLGIIMNEW